MHLRSFEIERKHNVEKVREERNWRMETYIIDMQAILCETLRKRDMDTHIHGHKETKTTRPR